MQLHVPTMLITTIVSAILVGLVLRFAGSHGDAPGLRETRLSAFCLASACLLILLRDLVPEAVRIISSNGLMWMGFALQWQAYARFDGRSGPTRGPLVATATAIVCFAAIYALGADYRTRSMIASVVVAGLALGSAWQLMANGGLRRERARGIGAGFAIVTSISQCVRIPLLVQLPSGDGALLSGSLEQSVAFFPAMVHVLGVGLGFLVMLVERNEAQAEAASRTDPLTGSANRRAFTQAMTVALAQRARGGARVSIVLADIDRFKSVNDTHGHTAGDAVIISMAQSFAREVRPGDIVARLGGEEFCVMVRDAGVEEAGALAHRLAERLRGTPIAVGDQTLAVTASFGVAEAHADDHWESLFARADRALYASKANGRDRVTIDPGRCAPAMADGLALPYEGQTTQGGPA